MYSTLTCLGPHEPRLMAVAALIGVYAAFTSLLLARWAVPASRAALGWIAAAATIAGCGAWFTHFIAMLAFRPGLPTGYDIDRTVLSAVSAVALMGAGFATAVLARRRVLGGAIAGLGVGAMHYVGISALQAQAGIEWDAGLVALSLLAGSGLSAGAFRTALGRRSTRRLLAGALLFALGVIALHFIAMAALRLTPAPWAPAPEHEISADLLGLGVVVVAVVILSFGTLGALIHHRLARRIAHQNGRLKAMADSAFEGLIIAVDGSIVECNERLAALIGHPPDDLAGQRLLGLVAPRHHRIMREHADHETYGPHDLELLHADGGFVPVEVRAQRIDVDGRAARLLAFRDMTDQRRANARIEYLAYHDALTGLPNRVLFHDRLENALTAAANCREGLALIFLDLDHFKDVNDVFGHATGDLLLAAAAKRLQLSARASDTVARLGGDEFAMICAGVADQNGAAAVAQRLIDVLAEPFDLNGHATVIGCTVGIALPTERCCADQLLRDADMALYRCKAEQRGTFRFFEEAMNIALRARKTIERDLRAALADDAEAFVLNYQPQIDLRSGRLIGVEALLRWQHPERGTISPGEFVPVAEESGLIVPLGAWALRRACAEAAGWPDVTVAVNLSPVQFLRPGLEKLVAEALADTGLPPERLEVEITERILLRDTEATVRLLHGLRDQGVLVAIDDFGTGYSSLSYLHRFPFDRIKIDRSFVSRIATDGDARGIVRAVVGLGRSLGVQIIAEGVETPEQVDLLVGEGCTAGQGYLFGRPMAAAAMAQQIERWPGALWVDAPPPTVRYPPVGLRRVHSYTPSDPRARPVRERPARA